MPKKEHGAKKVEDIRILLLQVRTDDMKDHEYECFLRYSRLKPHQVIGKSAFDDDLSVDVVEKFDALIIGGSGEFSVFDTEIQEVNKKLGEIIVWAYENNMPYLGACYGAQLGAMALGGAVEAVKEYQETGTFEIAQTGDGKKDRLFSTLPEKFLAQLGHKDSITKLPTGARVLARSKRSPVQAFGFEDRNFYGVQFHAELDKKDLMLRVDYYHDKGYVKSEEEYRKLKESVRETPEVAQLPFLFLEKIILGK